MKNIFILITLSFYIQVYSQDKCEIVKSTTLKDYATKKYSSNPIEGTEIIKIDNCKFLLGIGITSARSNNLSIMNRIASVKARRQVLQLYNGVEVTTSTEIGVEQTTINDSTSLIEFFKDYISETSSGFVSGMETLAAFKSLDKSNYIYIIIEKL
ncbi:hypothetical protein OAC93_04600 [Flavobacteriaceae bacterium]|nr:hypothetical protein [Flavobacteriaceae bacterium]MDB9787685.1 hypothetical protein [Flavobacteriaceae bacterium]MDB9902410.1 hypothetical protein [Flavobacteriaceae bacterium]